jgi:hypothetical protein
VPANEEAAVQVFCVEHGRWSGRREFTGAGGLAHGKLRLRAKYDGDQGKVWAEVAEKNAKLGAESSTGTYRKLAAGAEGERAVRPYREQLVAALDRLPEKNQVVGLVAAVNGRVVSVEVFATPELFRVYRQRLLDAVVMGAVDVPLAGNVEQAPTAAKVREFISKAEAAPAKEVVRSKSGRTVQKQATDVVNSTVETPVAAGQAPALIYKSYQATE